MSKPPTLALPEVGASSPQSMRISVVLPDPLGPSRPKISPRAMLRFSESTATRLPKLRVRFSAMMASGMDRRGADGLLCGKPARERKTAAAAAIRARQSGRTRIDIGCRGRRVTRISGSTACPGATSTR